MRILILLCFSVTFPAKPFAQKPECANFRTGNFTLYDSTTHVQYLIKRTEKKQTETDPRSGDKETLRVTWKDDCTYLLSKGKDMDNAIVVKIIASYGNTYQFSANAAGSTIVMFGWITKQE